MAELPLIGTRFQYRQLGMCRILMNELERVIILSIFVRALDIYTHIYNFQNFCRLHWSVILLNLSLKWLILIVPINLISHKYILLV